MEELGLKDLQKEGLKIMKVVDKWCVNNHVHYTLCGGR